MRQQINSNFLPNSYQEDIIDWSLNDKGSGIVNAVAGSGKSTLLKLVASNLADSGISPEEIKVIVFGKQNQLDLVDKFGVLWKNSIATLHSTGYKILRQEIGYSNNNNLIQSNKYRLLAQDLNLIPNKKNGSFSWGKLIASKAITKVEPFLNLVNLVRLTLSETTPKKIKELIEHFNLEGINNYFVVAREIESILVAGQEEAIDRIRIDFTDMIWLPVYWGLNERPWFKTIKWILLDECQDLNPVQLELSLMLKGRGRMLAVGDPQQAIFGFCGSDCNSYYKIKQRTSAIELPLSLCYRCPKTHLELVKSIYPNIPIFPKSNAIKGKIKAIEEPDLVSGFGTSSFCLLQKGDLVLSRKTAPLVSLCIRLIGSGIAAKVKGKDIGKQIKVELKEIAKIPFFSYSDFLHYLEQYRVAKFTIYNHREDEGEQLKIDLVDKLNALSTIYKSKKEATNIQDLCKYIDTLFSDSTSPVTLLTCHRAKGLESDRVFILNAEDLPLHWCRQNEWQKQQEDNLLYVALTRSKSELYIVGNPTWEQNFSSL